MTHRRFWAILVDVRIVINGWFRDRLTTGSGQYLAALNEWLPRVGDEHEFVAVQPAGPRATQSGAAPGVEWTTAPTPFDHVSENLAKLWFEQVSFPAACRRLRAAVAFVPYWAAPWWSPCPVVVTVHDLIPLLLPAYRGGALQRGYTWLVGRTARRAAAVLADSEASRQDVIRHLHIAAGRVHAVHLAADARFQPGADAATLRRVRERYALPDGPFLLYLGGFDARKNLARTLEAYARLVQRLAAEARDAPRLVIAGKLPATDSAFAPDPRPIIARLALTEHVHLPGWVDEADKPALYALAAGALFVSEYEGFGLPVLEAMAAEPRSDAGPMPGE
ncbi:MAG: Alpha-D-kanosaminyltransferase [Chloroflexi bacterium ADurb.Bin325]|nr:MAG: Alpha-D-kanosaminyltransferase [Chloroflexi bacterium ADurb.Bin325]